MAFRQFRIFLMGAFVGLGVAQAQSLEVPKHMQVVDSSIQQSLKSKRQERSFSLWGEAGIGKFVTKRNTLGYGSGSWGMTTALGMEYFVPFTNFSLTAGYINETLYGAGNAYEVSVDNLAMGGRYYVLPYRRGGLQPYFGLSALWSTSTTYNGISMVWEDLPINWEVKKDLPKLSLQPSVGIDINVLSLITFYAAYSVRLGLGSGAVLQGTTPNAHYEVEHTAVRHGLTIGAKINYPFRWKKEDTGVAAGMVVGTMVNQIDQHYNNSMINRSRQGKGSR